MKYLTSAFFLLCAAVTAQGPYYVNGQSGIDSPTNGTSPAAAWKTIGYALAHVPPQTPSTSDIVYVEGNQVYSPATNGEVFPIAPAYNIWLEGTFAVHGQKPVIQVPAGGTGFLFPGNQSFNRNAVTFRYLVIENGAFGMRMGSDPGSRHRPRVQDCIFRNQTTASVSIQPLGASVDDPRFFQNTFVGSTIGIEASTDSLSMRSAPDIEECEFRTCGVGVVLEAWSQAASGAMGQVRSCNLDACVTGVRVASSMYESYFDILVSHCRFSQCVRGIHAESLSMNSFTHVDRIVVTDSVALNCGTGIDIDRVSSMGQQDQDVQIRRSTLRDCGVGVRMFGSGNILHIALLEDVIISDCQTGWSIVEGGDPGLSRIVMIRSMVSRCGVGIDSWLYGEAAYLRISSSILAGCVGVAIRHYGFPGGNEPYNYGIPTKLEILHSTIADSAVGVAMLRDYAPVDVISSILGGNSQDFQVAFGVVPEIGNSCLQASSWPGNGNLNLVDPQLLRPSYKLAPNSPCIDAGALTYYSPATDYEGDPRGAVGVLGGSSTPDIGADEYVYAGSAHPYGTGGFGPFNIFPHISVALPDVRIGMPVQVELSGAIMPIYGVAANYALLSLGWNDDPGALPFDLAAYGLSGSYLWNEPFAIFPLQLVTGSGTASLTHTIPNVPYLIGQSLTHQWFALMPVQYGIVASEGLRLTIGQ